MRECVLEAELEVQLPAGMQLMQREEAPLLEISALSPQSKLMLLDLDLDLDG